MNVSALIRLHFFQAYRILREVGFIVLILLFFVSVAFTSQFILFLIQSTFWESLLIGCLLLSFIHLSRKDLTFLQLYCSSTIQLRQILLLEYLLLLAPLILIALAALNWIAVLGFGLSSLLSLLLPIHQSSLLTKSWNPVLKWIPLDLFEIRSLVRRQLPFLLIFYLIGWFSFFHIAFFILSMVISSALISSAFEWVEPPALIKWQKHFFTQKIFKNSIFVQAIFSPIYLMAFLFHLDEYYFSLIGLLMMQLVLIFSIFYKYALYRPQTVRLPQHAVHAVFFLFLLIPGLQPVSMLLCIWYAVKAKKTMSYFWKNQPSNYASDS